MKVNNIVFKKIFENPNLLIILECGAAKIPQGRIVGGNTTFEGEHPWMVAIFLHGNNRKEFWCGGILVSRHTIVTAAHCTKDAKKRP